MTTMSKIEAMVNAMTKYIVLAIIVLAAMTIVRCDAFAEVLTEDIITEDIITETIEYEDETREEAIIQLGENQALVVDCDYEKQDLRIYTVEYRSAEDYGDATDNYVVIGVRRIDMTSGETYLDWVSPWRK